MPKGKLNKINGTIAGETIVGSGLGDLIGGSGGDDVIYGYGDGSGVGGADPGIDPDGGGPDDGDVIDGGDGNDTIYAGGGDDKIKGGDGDDLIHAGSGDDNVNGGAGYDIAHLDGGFEDYSSLSRGKSSIFTGPDGTKKLTAVEELHFSDGVIVYLDGTNNAPVAMDDEVGADEDNPAVITAAALLANDIDFEGDAIDILSVDDTGMQGTLTPTFSGGFVTSLNYDPGSSFDYLAAGEQATETFTYELGDGGAGTSTATVTITIDGLNDAPQVDPIAQTDIFETTNTDPIAADIGVSFTDVDLSDTGHTATVTSTGTSGVTAGLALDPAGLAALITPGTVSKASGSTSGSVVLVFSADSTVFDYLATGETVTLSYEVMIDDLHGGQASQSFEVVITGTNGGPSVELADIAIGFGGFVINGAAESDQSGHSVSSAGDVNGDGLDDLIVGALDDLSYVVFGKADTTAVELSDVAAGTGGFVMNGIALGDRSGWSVSSAGDVNGDGLDDLIVGATYASPNGLWSGASYVVFGKADGTAVELSAIAAGSGGFVINGAAAFDNSGWSVSDAGDVNGDGFDDLIVATGANDYYNDSYVVFGKADGTAVELSDIAAGTGGFAINGAATSVFSVQQVSSAGDVNGDGLDDLIVGAGLASPNGHWSGASYVVFGKTDGTAVEVSDIAAGIGGFVINGVAINDFAGFSVSSAGDVNGDGLDDLIVGTQPDGGSDAGASYVVFGKADTTAVEASDIAAGIGGFAIYGVSAGDSSGSSVSSAGDVNGDGLADLIVGARYADPNGDRSGASYVVYGKADGTAVDLSNVAAGVGGFVINGVSTNDESGQSVSSAGDVNGDGFDDLIVGAFRADPNGDSSGASYVIFGGDSNPANDAPGIYVIPRTSVPETTDTSPIETDILVEFVDPDAGDVGHTAAVTFVGASGETGGLTLTGPELAALITTGAVSKTGDSIFGSVAVSFSAASTDFDYLATGQTVTLTYSVLIDDQDGGQTSRAFDVVIAGTSEGPGIELADIAVGAGGFAINGAAAGDWSGSSVSHAGDVNGDGFDDLIVGAYRAGPNGILSGASYVVFGKAGTAAVELSHLGAGGFAIEGVAAYDDSGFSVSSAGDVDGDGLDDLIVGAPRANPGGLFSPETGASYVVFGKADGTAVDLSDIAAGSGGFAINGVSLDSRSGFSVSSAGDVNGDGLDDLIVGAPLANASYVVFGKAGGTAVELSDIAAGTGGFAINGAGAKGSPGWSVSNAGDVNGDGFDDLIVGARYAGSSFSGVSYVVFGKADGTAVDLTAVASGSGGFAINGAGAYDYSGWSVSSAGDVNGDGLADLIVGAPSGGLYAGDPGASYVIFGKADGTAVDLSDIAAGTGGFVINGAAGYDKSGFSVSSAGDVNGDGLDDLIVGAPGSNDSYVVFGQAGTTAVDLTDVALGTGGFVINGAGADYSGTSVSAAGDVNGDGFDDLIVGAYGADPNGIDSGAGYVVFGGNFSGIATEIGSGGADTLTATAGDDQIFGGRGDDVIQDLGEGTDRATGGEGDDTFVFLDIDGTANTVTIADFEDGLGGQDLLDVSGFGFADFAGFLAVASAEGPGGHDTQIQLDADSVIFLMDFELAGLDAGDVIL